MENIIIFAHDDEFLECLLVDLNKNKTVSVTDVFVAGNVEPRFMHENVRIHLRKDAMSGNSNKLKKKYFIDCIEIEKYSVVEQFFHRMCDTIDYDGSQFSGIERRRYFYDLLEYSLSILTEYKGKVIFTDNPHSPHDVVFAMVAEQLGVDVFILRETHLRGRYFVQYGLRGKLDLTKDILKKLNIDSSSRKDLEKFFEESSRKGYSLPSRYGFRRDHKVALNAPSKLYYLFGYRLIFRLVLWALCVYRLIVITAKHAAKKIIHRQNTKIIYEISDLLKISREELPKYSFTNIDLLKITVHGNLKKRYLRYLYSGYEFDEKSFNLAEKKYVYFPLHYQPEATTYPFGRYYIDQYIAIELLSQCLPDDYFIIIKEHPDTFNMSEQGWVRGDFSRDHYTYEKLSSIKNVIFAPMTIDPFLLIDHSLFVATITGTTALQAIIRKKCAVVFGDAWFRDFDGIYYTPDKENLSLAIRGIITNFRKPDFQLNKYNWDLFIERTIKINRDNSNTVGSMGLASSAKKFLISIDDLELDLR